MDISSTSYPLKSLPLFSGSALKIIAVLSMMTDHCAYYLMDGNTWAYEVMRCFGRVAFPVFAFLVAEGFAHTRNRMRYFLSLLLFAAISEVPWYLLNGADGTHNVMFTLALGVAALAVFERLQKHGALAIAAILLVALSAEISVLDYGWHGIVEILVFHLFRSKKYCQSTRLLQLAFAFPFMSHYGIIGALLACFIIFLYNGTRGIIHGKVAKYGFYAIYPVHLIIIKLFFH